MEIRKHKPLIYICGATTVPEYYKAFEDMEDKLTAMGCNPLSPARLPEGLAPENRHRITTAMIDSADAVVVLPNWCSDEASIWERHLAYCFDRPLVELREQTAEGKNPEGVVYAWLKHDLEQALGEVSA